MKRYDHGGGWRTEATHGKWVLYEDSQELVAALQVAHEMEVKNLKSEIDALKAELAALKAPPKVLSADEVKETGAYWWREHPAVPWEPVYLLPGGELVTTLTDGSTPPYKYDGEFIGPIQTPEV